MTQPGPYDPRQQQPQQWQPQPYGQQPYPPPGYGYPPPPPPPKRSNTAAILMISTVVFVLVVGGCFAVVLNVDNETAGRETLATPSRGPATSKPTAPPSDAATAPEEQPAGDTPAGGPAAIGSAITLQGLDSDVQVDATVTQIFDPATSENDFIKPKAGTRWVAVELQLKNIGTAVYTDAPSIGLKLIDGEGQQYSQTFGDVEEGEVFSSITVNPGDTRKGVVLFEVPEGVKLAKLQFALNTGFASETGEWAIS